MIARSRTWQLQEAKNRFSEVIRRARNEGPQVITLRGEEVAVLVDVKTYRRSEPGTAQADFILRAMKEWADENQDVELELPQRTVDWTPPPRLDDGIT
jgi:prevent-host-death family protein